MANQQINIDIPEILLPLFTTTQRFICLKGGRGSAKSHTVARFLLLKGMENTKRILCCREIQKSISSSVHQLLSDIIKSDPVLSQFYQITEKQIRGLNGTLFIFMGLFQNETNVKSTEGIDYCWIEEAQNVSRKSLAIVVPTVRNLNSQIIFTYNPTNAEDPVNVDYGTTERPDTLLIEANYYDNPFFPEVLRTDMEYDRAHDPDKYNHVWLGKPVAHSDAQIFKGRWAIDEFTAPDKTFFYFGADFGYSADPSTLIRCYVLDNKLYIDKEFYGQHIEINHLPVAYDTIAESHNYPIFADSARPDTISYIRNHGFPNISGEPKTKVEDGIAHLKSFEKIIIHPDCTHTIDEFRLYSYVTDKQTGLISTKIEDKNNHCIDALRYSVVKLIKQKRPIRILTDVNF